MAAQIVYIQTAEVQGYSIIITVTNYTYMLKNIVADLSNWDAFKDQTYRRSLWDAANEG